MIISLDDIEAFVLSDYACKDIMHNLSHIRRIVRLSREIAENHEHDSQYLLLGAYFHGIVYLRETEIRQFLKSKGFTPDAIDKAVQVAWESQKGSQPETLEGAILHDAHLLEGGRTFHITKSLVTGTARGQTLEETIRYLEENVLGRHRCCLPKSQELYEEKERFAREFLEDLKSNL